MLFSRAEVVYVQQPLPGKNAAVLDVRLHFVALDQPLDEVSCRGAVLRALWDPEQPVAHHAETFAAGTFRDRDVSHLADHLGNALRLDDAGDLRRPGRGLERLPDGDQPVAVG